MQTCSPEEQPKQDEIIIRFAETDDDVIAIHRFLLMVLAPEIEKRCPVNPVKSLYEIIRVTKEDAAIMAIKDGLLIGTMGIMKVTWWFGDDEFLTDRWDAILPEHHHDETRELLMREVKMISDTSGLKFVHQGKIREMKDGTGLRFPRMYTPIEQDTPTLGSA